MEPNTVSQDLLPVRMLNEYAYCPRLYFLMHLEGRWEDNAYTLEGRHVHRRVDEGDDVLPEPKDGDDPEPEVARSVTLSSEELGVTAKLDLVEVEGGRCVPVETKRGRVPDNPERSWEPERVQLMAQGLLLRSQGFEVDHGILYFHGSRTRVRVPFTKELEKRTLELITEARELAVTRKKPPPLVESRKCNGCSLNGICLPDETLFLTAGAGGDTVTPSPDWSGVRRLYPPRDDALPLYVQEQGAFVGQTGRTLTVSKSREKLAEAKLKDVSQLVLCGNVAVSAQAMRLLCEAGIPVLHLSMGHRFFGITQGFGLRNAYVRAAQFKAAADPEKCLHLARRFVLAKGQNQRTMLRRNSDTDLDAVLEAMGRLARKVPRARSLDELLGLEGNLAGFYFGNFSKILRPKAVGDLTFDFKTRNRRPPRDPVNALLSFAYALLVKECAVALAGAGLDPHWGFYHQPRHGRPSLALDMMEELRPLLADSAVVSAVNMGAMKDEHFQFGAGSCMLTASGRKAFLKCYENRLDQLVTHPVFDYRCSWRRIIRVQAELLARYLLEEIPDYPAMVTR